MSDAAATTSTSAAPESAPQTSAETSAPSEASTPPEASAAPEGGAETQEASAEPAAPPPRKLRLKIDGQDEEHDEEQVIKLAQKGRAADRRFEEAHKLAQKAQQAMDRLAQIERKLTSDPMMRAYLAGDEEAVMQAMIARLEYESLPPEERRRRDEEQALRSKAQRYDEIERQQREAQQRQQREEQIAALTKRHEEEAKASLSRVGLDAADPEVMERWIVTRSSALSRGEQMTADEAAARVAERMGSARKSYFERLATLEGDALLAEVPEAVLTRMRAADAARLTARQLARNPVTGQFQRAKDAPPPPSRTQKRSVSPDKWLRVMRSQGVDAANRLLEGDE